jgi:hypothetical protein
MDGRLRDPSERITKHVPKCPLTIDRTRIADLVPIETVINGRLHQLIYADGTPEQIA